MPEIRPFAGVRYSSDHLTWGVLSPPFDVLTEADRLVLLKQAPHNVTAIDKGPEGHGDPWYAEAATLRDAWLDEGVLLKDKVPALYGYRQVFTLEGETRTRVGFMAAVRLAPWGEGIHPHERTRTGDRADRLKLTRAMRANMSPVFGLYKDAERQGDAYLQIPAEPLLDRAMIDGVEHTFWRIDDPAQVASLQQLVATRDVVIADGHHRYETALAYQTECRAQTSGDTNMPRPYDYVMMYLTNADDSGLVILPTHRVITGDEPLDQEALLHRLNSDFDIYSVREPAALSVALRMSAQEAVSIGMATQDMGVYVLRLKPEAFAQSHADSQAARELHRLDVMVLQERILAPILGISAEMLASGERVSYTTEMVHALRSVSDRRAQAAFILNATTVKQVWQMATSGLAMPQKSTFFYPKLLTGLVINPLDER